MKTITIIFIVLVAFSMGLYGYLLIVDPLQLKLKPNFVFPTFWLLISLIHIKRRKLAIFLVILFTFLFACIYFTEYELNILFYR